MRRVVTGHDARGKSIIELDEGPAKALEANGGGLFEIWLTKGLPAEDNQMFRDYIAEEDLTLCPPEGAIKVRWFAVPPEDPNASPEDKEAAAAFGFTAVGANQCRIDTTRHPSMHKTKTVDYIILVKGEVDMLVDEGEVTSLTPGDVVIQRGTNHAWVNHGTEPALFVAVLADAEM
ncbi:cupin domain-containing protein [bacterium AH-315-P15]|nr:cupin domain-containing protein [bacterium AH-315-P15]